MNSQIALIPQPQRIERRPGSFKMPVKLTYTEPGVDRRISRALTRDLPNCLAERSGMPALLKLEIVTALPVPNNIAPEILAEAYRLTITPKSVRIEALGSHGLFNGIQTLRQIVAQAPRRLPAMVITDWPDLSYRGIHYMMGWTPRYTSAYMKHMILTMARHKFTHLVLEYDDQFPWKQHPAIASPSAFTAAEIKEMVKLAEENFIEITPLLDSLGHAQQYLAHKPYAHLAENKGDTTTLCPRHPGTLKLMQDLWREVLALHPGARYANITGDEVMGLAVSCPHCKPEKGNAGVARLFTEYYSKLIQWIREQGRIPMIWGDMLIKNPEDLKRFPRNAIVCDWCYDGQDSNWWRFTHWHKAMDGSFSKERQALFDSYWHKTAGDPRFIPYPYTRFFIDQGFPVIGATGSDFCNNKRFAMTVKANKGMGLLVTLWDMHKPPEAAWFGLISGADFAWHTRDESIEDYSDRFARSFMGLPPEDQDLVRQLNSDLAGDNADASGFMARAWPESRRAQTILARARRQAGNAMPNRETRELFTLTARCNVLTRRSGALFNRIDRMTHSFRKFACVDLSKAANSDIEHATPPGADPLQVSAGPVRIAGVPFKIIRPSDNGGKSVVYLKGRRRPEGPESVTDLTVHRKVERLYVLLTAFDVARGAHIADLALNMADGTRLLMPLKDGLSLSDWRRGHTPLSRGILAWKQPLLNQNAYMCWFDNPAPDQELRSIDIVSTGNIGYPIILAVTAAWQAATSPSKKALTALDRQLAELAGEVPRLDAAHAKLFAPMTIKAWRNEAMQRVTWRDYLRSPARATGGLRDFLAVYRRRLKELA